MASRNTTRGRLGLGWTVEVVPAMAPRDETVFPLHTSADIEHALMVQYLYVA